MNTAQILGYPLLIISALEFFLGLLLLKQNFRNSPVNKATAASAFAAAVWCLSSALMYIEVSLGHDFLFFARFSWVGWFTVPAAIQTVFYLADEQSRKARIVGMILYPFWTVVLGFCLFTDLVVTPGFIPYPYQNSPGPLEAPLRTIGSLTAFWLIGEIIRLKRRTAGYRRSQLGYYLYGTIIFGTGGAVIGGLLQVFTGRGLEPSLSAYFSLPWVLMIFYAITRHRLFDIRFAVSRTLFILVLSFCVSAFQFVVFKMLEPVVGAVATIFISVPIIGIIFFGTPLSRNVQQWINELVLRGRYQYQQMLKDTATAMVTILDREELLRFAVERIRSGLGVREVSLYIREADGSYSNRKCGRIGREADGCILPQNVVDCLISTGQPIILDELSMDLRGIDTGLMETIRRIKTALLFPLVAKGRLLGILTLSERSNGEPFLQGDLDALQTLASHTTAALENADLFEETVQARANLRESENVFRILAETTTAGIFIFRPERILYVNKAGALMCGYSVVELLSMSPWAIIHPEYRSVTLDRGRAMLQGQKISPQNEFKFITKEGGERWALSTSASLELQGEAALITTLVDVTDLKKAEDERARLYLENEKYYRERIAEQERFSAILSTTGDGFWIVNEDNRIVFVNDAYCRMSGYNRDELLTMSIVDVEARESRDAVREHTDRIRAWGHDLFETRHRRKDGTLIDLEVSVNRYRNEQTVFAFLREITDRKRLEAEKARLYDENLKHYQERIAEQERFAVVLSASSDGFCIVGNDARFLHVNDAWCLMLGYTRDEMLSLTISDLAVHLTPEFIQQRLQLIRERGHDLFETLHRRNDGKMIDVEISINYYHTESVFFAFLRDISDRKRSERERERMVAEKEKILKDLHDGIGGLTSNINLLAELAQKNNDLQSVRNSLATISDLSRESLSEIRSFIQSLDAKELSWQAIAAEFRSLGNTIVVPHGIAFSLDARLGEQADGPNSTISMNLFRIYKESLANIIKHAKASAVDVSFIIERDRVVLDIRDNGIGLDSRHASGRGLQNMKSRTKDMNGSLAVTADNGTRVRLELPIP
jgi:PAS domain S-box-containing protein